MSDEADADTTGAVDVAGVVDVFVGTFGVVFPPPPPQATMMPAPDIAASHRVA
jgi:hypothetical protein